MEAISRIGTASDVETDAAGSAIGLLGQVQNHLIGHKASRWLEANRETVFDSVDRAIDQTAHIQSKIQNLLENMALGVYPTRTVPGPDGPVEQEMDEVGSLKLAVDLLRDVIPMVDKLVSTRNRVAAGGGNLMTAALLTSNNIRMQSMRQERSANPAPRKRYGVDKLVIEGEADVVGEA